MPRVPKGHDAENYCRACLHFSDNALAVLVPQLEHEMGRRDEVPEAQRYRRSTRTGIIDDLVDAHVEQGCNTLTIRGSRTLKASCDRLVEDRGEELALAITRWASGRRSASELRALLCAKAGRACRTSDLSLVPHPNTDGPPEKTQFFSERPPAVNDGAVFVAVGATLNETLNAHPERDLVLFISMRDETHDVLSAMVEQMAQLLGALPRGPGTFEFVRIDGKGNELPPPWDVLQRSTLVFFPAGRPSFNLGPGAPGRYSPDLRILEWMDPSPRTLHEVCHSLVAAFADEHSKRHVGNLLAHLGDKRVFAADGRWWEDDALLARAREPFDEQHEAMGETVVEAMKVEYGSDKQEL